MVTLVGLLLDQQVPMEWAFKGPPYVRTVELLEAFRRHTPPEKQTLITDLFETITLYDSKVTDVASTILPDGRHKLILKDEASGDFSDRVVAGE